MTIQLSENNEMQQKHIRPGFTLIEIMIALLIIGSVVAGSVYFATRYLEQSRVSTTETKMNHLKFAITQYQTATSEYPNALTDLITQPQGVKNWRKFSEKQDLNDAWGQKFVYRRTPEGEHPFELYSYGGSKGKREPKANRINAW